MPNLPRAALNGPSVRRRGSVLIVTLIFAAGVALSIGSFLALTLNSAKLSQHSFQANGALNLAEAGLELAFSAMNKEDYTNWSVHPTMGNNSRYMEIDSIDLGQGIMGRIRVVIRNITTVDRRVVAEGIASPPSAPPVRKQIEIRAKRRSIFATGLVSKDMLTFSGNGVTVNSWNSDPNGDGSVIVPYSDAVDVRNDNGSVASTAVTINIGNADVWGYVATGKLPPNVGNQGTIADYDSPIGTKDPDRISTDFKHNFEPVDVPSPGKINLLDNDAIGSAAQPVPLTLPRVGDEAWIDPSDKSATPKYYYTPLGVHIGGNNTNVLTISDDVVFLMYTGSGASAVGVSSNASINIQNNATLAVYTQGNIDIGGKGVINGGSTLASANQPKALQIYGTNTSEAGQSIKIAGNGVLSAVAYAPNADLTINGGGNNGHVLGSFVAKTITITGHNSFHYDESLKDFGDGDPFELESWIELFGNARVAF